MAGSSLGQAKIPIVPDLEGLDPALQKARGKINSSLGKTFSKLGGTLAKVGKAAVVTGLKAITGAVVGVGAALATTIGPASDLGETVSKVGVVFGDKADDVLAFGKTAATALGMSEEAALSAAGTYGNLFRSMGMTEDKSADMSTGIVELAADLASFNNMDPEVVLEKLRAGLTGETEPLKSLGVNLNQAAIEAKAMEMGLIGVDDEMTAAAKAQATYALVTEQTSLAQGDFARTSDGLANQQRILGASMTDLRAKIGTALLPVIETLTGAFNDLLKSDKVQAVIQGITDTLATFGERATEVFELFAGGDTEGGLEALFGAETVATVTEVVGKITEFVGTIGTLIEKVGGLDVVLNTLAIIVGGVLVYAFGAWAVAAWAAMAPMLPIIAVVAAIIAVVALAALAWQNDWGGIQTTMTEFWTGTLQPIFQQMQTWLAVNIPLAIAALSAFWTDTLLPAIQAFAGWVTGTLVPILQQIWDWLSVNIPLALAALSAFWTDTLLPAITSVATWITGTLVPILQQIWDWLSVNIPLALATLATFWTDTLLPAITTVWAFIQDSVVPLLTTLVDVTIAALQLALTALAGLWENVLLPAITSVSTWFTEEVVPALEDVWSWISEKLSPVVETVVEWFDKFTTSGGGLSTILKTVTDKVSGLATKLGALKLPDWLTPGSPTPMENGLVGIAAALGPVVDQLLDFGASISGDRAKAMKNMASAFKDMAKGIDKMASALTKIEALTPSSGGTSGFGAMLDNFETVFMQAAAQISKIIAIIGEKEIKRLRKSAKRMADIINVVLIDLSGITEREMPDLDVWFDQFYNVFLRTMSVLKSIRDEFGDNTVKEAALIAQNVGIIMQLLGADLAAMIPPPPNFEELLGTFMLALAVAAAALIPFLSTIRTLYGSNLLAIATETATSIGTIMQILGTDLAAIIPPPPNFEALLTAFLDALLIAAMAIIPFLTTIRTLYGGVVLTEATDTAKAVGAILQLLGVELAAIIPPPPNFEALLTAFLDALLIAAMAIIPFLTTIRTLYGGVVLTEATDTAAAISAIVGVLSLATLFAELGSEDNQPASGLMSLVQTLMDNITGALDILIPGLDAIQVKWGDALARVAGIAELMQRVFEGAAGAQTAALGFATADNIDMGSLMSRVGNLNAATGAAVAGFASPMGSAGAGAGVGGAGTVTVNVYLPDGGLAGTFTEESNEAGEVDIRIGEIASMQ